MCTKRQNGNSTNSVSPNTICSLKMSATPSKCSAAPAWKVTIDCAHATSFIISLPSICWAENGIVSSPKHTCTTNSVKIRISPTLEVARTRGLVKRRFNSITPPINIITPHAPPANIAIFCLTGTGRNDSYIQCGVSMPRKCPAKIPKIPIWNRLEARRIPFLSNIWLEPARQLYWP